MIVVVVLFQYLTVLFVIFGHFHLLLLLQTDGKCRDDINADEEDELPDGGGGGTSSGGHVSGNS